MSKNLAKDFTFNNLLNNFIGYNSAYDKTKVNEAMFVRGSQNVYKLINGNIGNRPGLKRRGAADSALSGVSSEFVWGTSWGETYPIWVANSLLQVEIDGVWITLQSGLTETRYVFDKWWDNTLKKDKAVFVNGNDYIQSWAGGVTTVASATSSTLTKSGTATWTEDHFETPSTAVGSSTSQFDITNPSGTTFKYLWDGTGTNPGISATTAPIGSYVYLAAQNFSAANNGLFVVTGSGSNYFEVTNALGVAENNKTIGTGSVFISFKNFVNVGGTQYAYSGGAGTTTLTGVLPNPSALTATTVVTSPIVTSSDKPADGFASDFCKVVNNRLFVGSYTSRLVYISSSTDFTNFTIPASIIPGSPNLLTLDGTGKGISIRKGVAHVSFGTNGWVSVNFPTYTTGGVLLEQITPQLLPVQALGAAYSHEMIDTVGDNIVYLAQDQQARYLGDTNNAFTTVYPSLSQEIFLELQEEDFTDGSLNCIGDFTYITAPNSGKVYLYQVRQSITPDGQVFAERLWHSPFIWNASRVDEIDGQIVAFSNSNPQVYYVWDTGQYYDDSPSDEAIPYDSILAFAYRTDKNRTALKLFDKIYTEGYLTPGTTLNLEVNYNWNGASGQLSTVINSSDLSAYLFQTNVGALGDTPLGDVPLGDTIIEGDGSDLVKFKNIKSLSQKDCFEYQLVYSSENVNDQWQILATGTNAVISDESPGFLINKLTT